MKCLLCEDFSASHICKSCQSIHLKPSLFKRKVLGVDVFSFYRYDDIKELLFTKHTDLGFYIYSILAKNSFQKFADEFIFDTKVASIAVDDNVESGYSHTAILNKHLKSRYIKPLFNKLRAKNRVSYSGESKEFRLNNPREFYVRNFKEKDVVIVDDIVTTGWTLTQAIQALKEKNILFCLTLADASL